MTLSELDKYNLEMAHKYLDQALECVKNKRRARAQVLLTESITYYSKVPRGYRDDEWEEKAWFGLPRIMGSQM